HGGIKRLSFAQWITLRRFKVWIINPKLTAIADRDTGRIAFDFAPEFIRRLEPNRAGAENWLLHQPKHSLLLKIGLRAPVLSNACEKIFEISLRKRCCSGDRCEHYRRKPGKHQCAHAMMLCRQIEFSKHAKICVR